MSDLDWFRAAMREVEKIDKGQLLQILSDLHNETREHAIARDRADLYARRCEIALAILRDDAEGLSPDKLNAISEVVYPRPFDSVCTPTQPVNEMQIACLLLGEAKRLMDRLLGEVSSKSEFMPETLADLLIWKQRIAQFCASK